MGGIVMINKDYSYNFEDSPNSRYVKLTVWNNDFSDYYHNEHVLRANRVHSKYYKNIKHLCTNGCEYIIDGELYRIRDGKIKQITNSTDYALIQHLKTKDKVLAVGMRSILSMIFDFISGSNMHRTGVKGDKSVLRGLRSIYEGDYYYPTMVRANGTLTYSWYNGEIDDFILTYGMSRDKVREIVRENERVYIDKDYNIKYKIPHMHTKDPTIVNDLLRDVFGGAFELKEIDIPSIKESGIC